MLLIGGIDISCIYITAAVTEDSSLDSPSVCWECVSTVFLGGIALTLSEHRTNYLDIVKGKQCRTKGVNGHTPGQRGTYNTDTVFIV